MKLFYRFNTPGSVVKIAALALFCGAYGVGSLVAEEPKKEETAVAAAQAEHKPEGAKAAPLEEGQNPAERAATEAILRGQGPSCIVDAAALEDMKIKREELVNRVRALEARESEIAAREKALSEEFAKLKEIRDQISVQEQVNSKQNEEKVAKLVETIEAMSGKASAALLAEMDEALAVAAITRISTPKLAKIMNTMEAKRSSRLVETMAGVVRARKSQTASNGAAATTNTSSSGEKGETNNDGKSKQSNSNANEPAQSAERAPGSSGSKR
jgi:flagellar motility protein MotE (MotC chaperone)